LKTRRNRTGAEWGNGNGKRKKSKESKETPGGNETREKRRKRYERQKKILIMAEGSKIGPKIRKGEKQ